jgi:nucleotide-binding universal stress UspA family protein
VPATIVVGVDDHDASREALRLGAGLAGALRAGLVVAAAIEYDPLPIEHDDYDRARLERFDRIFAAVDDELGALPYRRFDLDREVPEALRDLAISEGARMLVLGHTHRGTFGRIHPGTLGDRVVQDLECPVAVTPAGYSRGEHDGFGTIGVAYDGGQESKDALAFAKDLAGELDCRVQLLTVEPLYPDAEPSAAREWAYQERHKAGLRSIDGPAEGVFDRGDPAKVLARRAVDLDLLVVGSRSHGRLLRAALGSVSSELMRICPSPLVVVARSAGERVAGTQGKSVSDTDARETAR